MAQLIKALILKLRAAGWITGGLLLSGLVAQSAQAGVFDPPLTDRSVEYLGILFGGAVGGIKLGTSFDSSGFLGNLFQNLNGIVLSIAAIVLTYTGILSVVNTAQEGEIMGKKWSSVWIPLRSACGLLLLAPIPGSGYSLIQVTIVWIVLNGIGAADLIWNLVVDHLSTGISATQNFQSMNTVENGFNNVQLTIGAAKLGSAILRSLVCMEIFNKKLDPEVFVMMQAGMTVSFEEEPFRNNSLSGSLNFGANSAAYPRMKNVCGKINLKVSYDSTIEGIINSPTDLQKQDIVRAEYEIKKTALNALVNAATSVASDLVNAPTAGTTVTYDDLAPYLNSRGILASGILAYTNNMNGLTANQIGVRVGANLRLNSTVKAYADTAKAIGWILAGSYYYNFNRTNQLGELLRTALAEAPGAANSISEGLVNGTSSVSFDPAIYPSDLSTGGLTAQNFSAYSVILNNSNLNNLFSSTGSLSSQYQNKNSVLKDMNTVVLPLLAINPIMTIPVSIFYSQVQDVFNDLFDRRNANQDPLVLLAKNGYRLMFAAEMCWIGLNWAMLGISTIAGVMSACLPFATIMMGFITTFLPVILGVLGIGWGIGALLSIYMPIVPFMLFAVTALGWIISVIESVVAAPIVALGLVMPSQEEIGAVRPAIQMIASIFLKPILMIVGLLFASKLYKVLILMVNEGFNNTFGILNANGFSIFAWMGIFGLFAGFLLALENKCYSLIYHLPDKILSWIGVQGERTDVSGISEAKGFMDKGISQAQSMGQQNWGDAAGSAIGKKIGEAAFKGKKVDAEGAAAPKK